MHDASCLQHKITKSMEKINRINVETKVLNNVIIILAINKKDIYNIYGRFGRFWEL